MTLSYRVRYNNVFGKLEEMIRTSLSHSHVPPTLYFSENPVLCILLRGHSILTFNMYLYSRSSRKLSSTGVYYTL